MGRFYLSMQNAGKRKCKYVNFAQALRYIEPEIDFGNWLRLYLICYEKGGVSLHWGKEEA